ncbi:hypothetical protein [Nonomuraea sp. JJY05]|uniref:hypothetical protein n=1 Tax=Nonomuraea sp. JJY05 TaxID=3350255 RepID=UPI0037485E2C
MLLVGGETPVGVLESLQLFADDLAIRVKTLETYRARLCLRCCDGPAPRWVGRGAGRVAEVRW